MDDDDEEMLLGLAAGLDVPTAYAMADSGDDNDGDNGGNGGNGGGNEGCGCLTVLLLGIVVVSLAGLLIA